MRAGIAEKPEEYRWRSLGYHVQTNNKNGFLSLDFGLREFDPSGIRSAPVKSASLSQVNLTGQAVTDEFHGASVKSEKERLRIYRRFVHGKGSLNYGEVERSKDFEIGAIERFKYRSRYFSDSGIIGTKEFVSHHYQTFKHLFSSKHEKRPKTIHGMDGIYSLKQLSIN